LLGFGGGWSLSLPFPEKAASGHELKLSCLTDSAKRNPPVDNEDNGD
jgi:hypothetical protein